MICPPIGQSCLTSGISHPVLPSPLPTHLEIHFPQLHAMLFQQGSSSLEGLDTLHHLLITWKPARRTHLWGDWTVRYSWWYFVPLASTYFVFEGASGKSKRIDSIDPPMGHCCTGQLMTCSQDWPYSSTRPQCPTTLRGITGITHRNTFWQLFVLFELFPI